MDNKKTCDVCDNEPSVGVACVPMMPISVAYGTKCLKANAHPWGLLIGNTAIVGGYTETSTEWQAMVQDTIKHLNKTFEEFNKEVGRTIRDLNSFRNV